MNIKNLENFDVLEEAIKCNIVNLDEIRCKVENMKLKAVLEKYEQDKTKNRVWQGKGKDTRWKFRKEDGKIVAKKNEDVLKQVYMDYYLGRKDTEERDARKISFQEMFTQWVESQKNRPSISTPTIYKYNTDYKRCFAGSAFEKMSIADISAEDISDFLVNATNELGLKNQAVKNIGGYIRRTLEKAKKARLIRENPYDFFELSEVMDYCPESIRIMDDDEEDEPKKERVLTAQEMQALLKQLKQDQEAKPDYLPYYAIEMCMLTGLRVGEVVALKWNDIKDGELHIRRSEHRISEEGKPTKFEIGQTKTRKSRIFPISPDLNSLFEKLKKLQEISGVESGFIFEGTNGRIKAPHVSNCCFRETARAGFEKQSIHAIRRTVSSNLHKLGVPDATIAKMLGHSERVNRQHYSYDVTDLKEKLSLLNTCYTAIKEGTEIA
ncbi:hypothetical protein BEI60_22695 [Eisenbergiella tayi]|nr:hypothetical protein BEI60_22695 [Eisenbergiella tayi]